MLCGRKMTCSSRTFHGITLLVFISLQFMPTDSFTALQTIGNRPSSVTAKVGYLCVERQLVLGGHRQNIKFQRTVAARCSTGIGGGQDRDGNTNETMFVPPSLSGLRPIGVDDSIEGIVQAPLYDQTTEQRPFAGVGSKIGREKQIGQESASGDGVFGLRPREDPSDGRQRILEDEFNAVNIFSQEKGFAAALAGIASLAIVYVTLYMGTPTGMAVGGGGYGGGGGGGPAVVERYEEAFVCYGVPAPDDPNGCRDRRSVGPVRVLSPAAPPPAASGQAGPAGASM